MKFFFFYQQSPSNDICTEKDKPNFKLPLLGAMIFPESILLIDGHFRMYEVPRSNYEGSYGQMTLNIKGVPMERYWPAFAEVAQDGCFRQTYKTIYHLIFNKTGNVLIMFDVREGSCENVVSVGREREVSLKKLSICCIF